MRLLSIEIGTASASSRKNGFRIVAFKCRGSAAPESADPEHVLDLGAPCPAPLAGRGNRDDTPRNAALVRIQRQSAAERNASDVNRDIDPNLSDRQLEARNQMRDRR